MPLPFVSLKAQATTCETAGSSVWKFSVLAQLLSNARVKPSGFTVVLHVPTALLWAISQSLYPPPRVGGIAQNIGAARAAEAAIDSAPDLHGRSAAGGIGRGRDRRMLAVGRVERSAGRLESLGDGIKGAGQAAPADYHLAAGGTVVGQQSKPARIRNLEIISTVRQAARLLVLGTRSEKYLRLGRINVALKRGSSGKCCLDGTRDLSDGR